MLESDAVWHETHAQGPGLYGRIKPFSDFAGLIDEKGPYAGVSIRANGSAVMEAGRPVMREGVPVLAALTAAEGVDMVTRAGAGGMFLSESARTDPPNPAEGQVEAIVMDEAAVKKLIESAVSTATAPLKERALRGDATVLAARLLSGVSLSEAQKQYVITRTLAHELPVKEGALDAEKFGELLVAETKAYASTLGDGARVTGMGIGLVETPKRKTRTVPDDDDEDEDLRESARSAKTEKADFDEQVKIFESVFGMTKVQAEAAARGRDAA